ncbi:MAG TPA: polysaccharide deacetylase family protein [Allosphingosinicella sp.]|nr:polysaccharide deacetylase family protein [Allosphingosinicella sp.]
MVSARWRRIAFWTLVGLAASILVAFAIFEVAKARCFALSGEAICRVETTAPIVALTFDDGPTAEGVAWADAILRRRQARGTFFLIGGEVERREALVRRLLARGHEIGNHSFSHVRMIGRSASFYDSEIARTDAALRRAGVPSPGLFRPPYGKKLIGLPNALSRHHYRLIMWDVEDPPGAATPRAYAEQVVRSARPGSIILMHIMYRGNRVAREALPLVVEGLQARGFRLVTVSELLRHRR